MIPADIVIIYEEFKARYLHAADHIESVTGFWNYYNPNPIGLINNRQLLALRDRLFGLLTTCKRIDADAFIKIHKGHPYYFIGITSYLLQDYSTAIYFFDAALTEDLEKNSADLQENAKPSTRFFMLEGERNDQAAKPLTQDVQNIIQRGINYYNQEVKKNQSIQPFGLA